MKDIDIIVSLVSRKLGDQALASSSCPSLSHEHARTRRISVPRAAMEPIGLAAGLAGLAGLFSSCLEAAQRFDSWKNYGDDSRALGAHFEAEKLRLERWGQAAGFGQEATSRGHHKALDDPRIESRVHEHLSIIKTICSDANDISLLRPGASSGHPEHGLFAKGRTPPYPTTASESRRQRLRWAMWDKDKCELKLAMLGQLVQDLHNLVPPDGAKDTMPVQGRTGDDDFQQLDGTVPPRDIVLHKLMEFQCLVLTETF